MLAMPLAKNTSPNAGGSFAENQPDLGILTFGARLHPVRIDAGQKVGEPIGKGFFFEEEVLSDSDIRQ